MEGRPGWPAPLGASWDGAGVNFALCSEHATGVELCLFAADPRRETARIALHARTNDVWHTYVPGLAPGQRYAYRVHGPYAPAEGHRFDATKLLLDPYARAIEGAVVWDAALLDRDDPAASPVARDSADAMPRCVVVDPSFAWDGDRLPGTPWERTLLYEVHVKGFTARHPDVPAALRGTYAGLASPAAIAHLTALGVTAVELLPVHHSARERHLAERGLPNYWGYSSIGFFAPDARLAADAAGGQVREFQAMVRALHRAGIEVILDVVYNHTAEGDERGPTLAFRGIDNRVYYRLDPTDPRRYVDYTGCGNTLDLRQPRVLQLVLDSLRYWATVMHVDGFRFDLAPALARAPEEFTVESAFFAALRADPLLAHVKLIAEPWDVGPDGYRTAGFPAPWSEWNDRYRDAVRGFWRGDAGQLGELALRVTGSPDLYAGRGPLASVNFITAHDGFTLRDLVSYEHKHNQANGEDNRDGTDANRSWNCGAEGASDDPAIRSLRARQQRNLLATLLLSQGVPMLCAGDEIDRTQQGNNNAYCQDNDTSWLAWDLGPEAAALLAFTRRLTALAGRQPLLRRAAFAAGAERLAETLTGAPEAAHAHTLADPEPLFWAPTGAAMCADDWRDVERRVLGVLFADAAGAPAGTLLLLVNAGPEPVAFAFPAVARDGRWEIVLDTAREDDPRAPSVAPGGASATAALHAGAEPYPLAARALALLRRAG